MKKLVNCPNCDKQLPWDSGNRFRPFCSERCKLLDLGEWVSGGRYIPAESGPESEPEEE